MKLVGIEFHGFKSFADSAQIKFHDGITAIVGPNGCGKSNISDGLRWVLGEQRPTAIRGARMEEAIFQGTQKRKAIHRAEVLLRLSNEDHLLPVPYTDVQLSRIVHTGGESEYRLNGTLCRLRDVQDLCRDTGLGANAYAIIEGRMIDAILSDKAEERRAMFEEAAGIGRYKERRRVAARRLDEADADLARVDDLISEVQTKVRSLARQRGRARRFIEMRERKLALELALAQSELSRLDARRREIGGELEALSEARLRDSAQLRSAEAETERLRAELSDLERERADAARKLMAARDRLADRERERLRIEERLRHASLRLEQVEAEKRELGEQKDSLQRDSTVLGQSVDERRAALDSIRGDLQTHEVELAEVAERRQAMEAAEAAVESERESYREQRASLLAGRDSALAEARELERRLADAEARLSALTQALSDHDRSAEAGRAEAEAAEREIEEMRRRLEVSRARLAEQEKEHEELRAREVAQTERIHATAARIEALSPLTLGGEGLSPAVQAALERAEELGIHGVLGRSLEVAEPFAEAVEAYLGAFMEGLVVEDAAAVERIRRWFEGEFDGKGGLVLLPLDRLPADATAPVMPSGIRASGPGAAWAGYLLRGVTVSKDRPGAAGAWIGRRVSLDSFGVFRLGEPYAGGGILARRAELDRLQKQRAQLESEAKQTADRARLSAEKLESRRAELDQLKADYRSAEERASRLAARAEAAAERAARARDEFEAMRETPDALREERQQALDRAEAEAEALRALKPVGVEHAPDPDELAAVRAEWEAARERVTDFRLKEARSAAELDRVERELRARLESLDDIGRRTERLQTEEAELRASIEGANEELEKSARDLEALFEERAAAEREARELEDRAQESRQKVAELEGRVRRINQEERSHSERRHGMELEQSQIDANLSRTRERLEDEWGRPFDRLLSEVEPAEGEHDDLEKELSRISERLASIGLVNMLAEQEYQEQKDRVEFLRGQRDDLAKARDDLRDTIRRINETASKALVETLATIRENFKDTFATLFEGGECDVWLEDPEDPLESPIEISASPSGKRTQRIHLLSGGERALTALALLFAIYLVKPSPFCVMDEVDAPLDETNIRRFVDMLERFKSSVQFIIITHNPVTIEAADWIYGVTMEEPGVSKIVGVEFSDYARGAVA